MGCKRSPKCGWASPHSFYDCGTSGGSDPSGKYPKACSAVKKDSGTPDKGTTTPDKSTTTPDKAVPDQGKQDTGWLPPDSGKKEEPEDEGGCSSCSVGSTTPPSLPLMLLVLGALFFVRRRG